MAKITLENGVEFEGTAEELRDMFEKFGVKFGEGSAEGERTVRAREDFSVGDRVKLDVVEGNRPRYGWGGVKNGEIGTVSGIDGSIIRVDFPRHRSWSAAPSELVILEKAEEADVEVSKQSQELPEGFVKVNAPAQVGDYVKVTKSRHVDITVGKFYEVIKVYEGGYVRVKDDVGDGHDSGSRPNYEFEVYRKFEFIEGAPQVGDKVLITNAYITGGEYEDGDILTVEKHQPETFEYVEHITVEGIGSQINRDEFEIIERISETPVEIEEGDIVRIVTYDHGFEVGEIVEVAWVGGGVLSVKNGITSYLANKSSVELVAKSSDRVGGKGQN